MQSEHVAGAKAKAAKSDAMPGAASCPLQGTRDAAREEAKGDVGEETVDGRER